MPQQVEDRVYTPDDNQQYISIQAATEEELEEDDKYASLLFGKYDKYFHNGDGNYEELYRIAKLILPNALYLTWRGFIDFQVEPGSPCITNKKVAEYTNKNVRTIELNMQRMRQAGFMRTQHVLRGENWVIEKNFSGMYQAIIAYMQWEKSSAYMPPTREYFEVDGVDKDICSKVLHFNNYRRVLHNKRPGPKRKKVYPEEQAFIDGVFRELPTVQDSPSERQAVDPMDVRLESTNVLSEKASIQPVENNLQEEKVSRAGEAALLEEPIPMESAIEAVAVVSQVEMSKAGVSVVGAQASLEGTQTVVNEPLLEEREIQREVLSVETEVLKPQAEPVRQSASVEMERKPEEDGEESKNKIMKEYHRISKEENQEAAMQWISMQNLEWMQKQDWELMFAQNSEPEQAEDVIKSQEESVVEQEPACENKDCVAIQVESEDGQDGQVVEEALRLDDDFDKVMDRMLLLRGDHIKLSGEWFNFLHQLYDAYGRWAIDTHLIKYQACNQPKVPFRRFLKGDPTYKCNLYSHKNNYPSKEFFQNMDEILDFREEIYELTEVWEANNIWLSNYHGFNKVNQGYLDRLSPEQLKKLRVDVFEPEPEVPAKRIKDKYLLEQKLLKSEKNKQQGNGSL